MNRLGLAAVAAAALWVAACSSGGGSTITPPPPAGNYSLASLSGTYAFMTNGRVITNTATGPAESPLARVGSFFADGMGHITGGVEDVNANGAVSSAIFFNNTSSYTVNPDGRGTLTLDLTANGIPATINFAIVLTSGKAGTAPANDGLMIDETSTANQASTGSGNFILQNTSSFQTSLLTGTYTFDFFGLDSGGAPESIIGEFSASAGGITSGFEDANDNFALTNGPTGVGSFTSDPQNSGTLSSFGRGLATIAGETYAFYIVDPTSRVRLISIGTSTATPPMLTGDAILQSNIPASISAINGGFAFLVGGSDFAGNGLVRVGRLTATGATLSKLLMDVNDNASETQLNTLSNGTISTYDPATGRGMLSFNSATATFTFVFYLSSQNSGVIQEQTVGNTSIPVDVADGSILAQTGSPFSGSNIAGTYAMNWSGVVTSNGTQDEEDLVSQVKVSSLSLSGTSDIFQFTSTTLTPITDIGTKGTITFNGGDGAGDDGKRVDMTVNLSGASPIKMVVYIVNPQLAFFINTNQSGAPRIVAGILKAQQ
ncbi:MAG: hypothetical protein DMG35_12575 [Acidobacteria bacterium]|nr:MAG: hypothetical protein AUH86_07440 [Acidobacteria bacterium 13_1_40CM_4_58_4]PYT60139.1 MAG: hypothetical protein DMG35_12575 [Acidobacteriota bacterium]